MTVAVVDRGGQPLALLRDNLAGTHTVNTAIGKAATAGELSRRHSRARHANAGRTPAKRHPRVPNVVAIAGGIVVQAKGSLVGGIGVSARPAGTPTRCAQRRDSQRSATPRARVNLR